MPKGQPSPLLEVQVFLEAHLSYGCHPNTPIPSISCHPHPFPPTSLSHTPPTTTLLMDPPLPLLPATLKHPLLLALGVVNRCIPDRAVPPVLAGGRGSDHASCRRSRHQMMRNLLRSGGVALGQGIIRKGIFPSSLLLLRRSFLSVNEVGRRFTRGLRSGQRRTTDQNGMANRLKPSINKYVLCFLFPVLS